MKRNAYCYLPSLQYMFFARSTPMRFLDLAADSFVDADHECKGFSSTERCMQASTADKHPTAPTQLVTLFMQTQQLYV
jgi:hypothetical protein